MRFQTSFLITLAFQALILAIDKGAGFVILWLLREDAPKAGGVQLLLQLPAILVAIGNLGLAASLVYFSKRKEVDLQTAGRTTTTVAILQGLLLALVMWGALELWVLFKEGAVLPRWSLLLPMLFLPIFLLIATYHNYIQLAVGRIVGFNVARLAPSLCFLPLFLLLYFVPVERDAYEAAVYARFLPGVLTAVLLLWFLRDVVPLRLGLDLTFLKKAVAYGWRANLHATFTALNHRLDLYLLGALFVVRTQLPENEQIALLEREVAFYAYAMTIAELIWHFPEALRDVLFAKVSGLSEGEARDFTPVVARNSLWIAVLAAAGLWWLHAPCLSFLLGASWEETWRDGLTPVLALLLPGTVLYTIAKVLQADLMARRHLNACNLATFAVFVVLLGLDFVLVPSAGARGAAMASTIAYAVGAVLSVAFYVRSTGVSVRELLLVRRSDLRHYEALVRQRRAVKSSASD